MSIAQVFIDRKVASAAFTKTGMVRTPFTLLNQTPLDMIQVYAAKYLSRDKLNAISNALSFRTFGDLDVDTSSLYIFSSSTFDEFVKMSIMEDVDTDSERVYTSKLELLYTDNEEFHLTDLPKVTTPLLDAEVLKAYQHIFKQKDTYLLRCDTELYKPGQYCFTIHEFLLYLADCNKI